jgi:hypothetical protein
VYAAPAPRALPALPLLQVNSLAAAAGTGEELASGRCVVDLNSTWAAADGSVEAGGSQLEADLVVWTGGFSPVTKAARQGFPFPTNQRGALETVGQTAPQAAHLPPARRAPCARPASTCSWHCTGRPG